MKKNYTIVVMPPNGDTHSYVVGTWIWRLIFALSILLVLAVVSGVTWAVWLRGQKLDVDSKLTELRNDNQQKTEELEKAREYLDKIRELDADIRGVLFDDSESVGLGQGGFDADIPQEVDIAPLSSRDMTSPEDDAFPPADVAEYAQSIYSKTQKLYTHLEQKRSLYDGFPSIVPIQTSPGKKNFWFSSGYGYRTHPLTGLKQFHNGIDISARPGTPIIAPADGIVIFLEKQRYLGRAIKIEHQSFQGKHVTTYAHMKAFAKGLKVGDKVTRRQVIGYVGNSGRTTGYHLHYEVSTNGVVRNPIHYMIRGSEGQIK